MDAKTAAFDQMFGQLATNVSGVGELLDRFFSFLQRRTDFYVVDPTRTARMGFAPGHAERIVLSTFRKFSLKGVDGKALRHGSSGVDDGSSPGVDTQRASKSTKLLKSKMKSGSTRKKESGSAANVTSGASTSKLQASSKVSSKGRTAGSGKRAGARPAIQKTTTEGISEVWTTPRRKQLPANNGGAGPGYWWSQTAAEVTLNLPVAEGTRGRDLAVSVEGNEIKVQQNRMPAASGDTGSPGTVELLTGELGGSVQEDGGEGAGSEGGPLWVLETKPCDVSLVEVGASRVAFEALARESLLRAGGGQRAGAGAAKGREEEGRKEESKAAASGAGEDEPGTDGPGGDSEVDAPMRLASSTARRLVLQITLQKREETWWSSFIAGHPEIDTTRVDSSKHVSEYDQGTQSTIRRLMENQARKAKGQPSVEEEEAARVLERAKSLPGSPFLEPSGGAGGEETQKGDGEQVGDAGSEQGGGPEGDQVPRFGTGGTVSDPVPGAMTSGARGGAGHGS